MHIAAYRAGPITKLFAENKVYQMLKAIVIETGTNEWVRTIFTRQKGDSDQFSLTIEIENIMAI